MICFLHEKYSRASYVISEFQGWKYFRVQTLNFDDFQAFLTIWFDESYLFSQIFFFFNSNTIYWGGVAKLKAVSRWGVISQLLVLLKLSRASYCNEVSRKNFFYVPNVCKTKTSWLSRFCFHVKSQQQKNQKNSTLCF